MSKLIVPRVFTRDDWDARPARPMDHQSPTGIAEFFVHHSASPGKGIDRLAEQVRVVQEMQRFHMGPERGWSDIAYHWILFQPYGELRRARIFHGRPLSAVPAAQLGHNTNTEAVCVVSADGEAIKRATKDALIWLYRRSHAKRARGHFEVTGTECPGPQLKAFLPTLRSVK